MLQCCFRASCVSSALGFTQRLTFPLTFSLAIFVAFPGLALGQAGAFVRVVNSPRAVALGSGALLLVDQESVFHNPSAMALYHLETRLSATFPNNTKFYPQLSDDIRHIGASVTYSLLQNQTSNGYLSVGLFLNRFSLDKVTRLDESGTFLDVHEPRDLTYGLSLGYARAGHITYSFGITSRLIESNASGLGSDMRADELTASAALVDVAAMVKILLNGSEEEENEVSFRASVLQTIVTGKLNFADNIQTNSLPSVNQYGVALSANWGNPHHRSFSLLASAQVDSDITNSALLFKSKNRAGLELDLFEMVQARIGSSKDSDQDGSSLHSYGAGFNLGGLLKIVHSSQIDEITASGKSPWWNSFDLRFDIAKVPEQDDLSTTGIKLWKLSLAWIR